MPLFGFKCDKCGFLEDKLLTSVASGEPQKCPKCGETMIKLFSAPRMFEFKGSGFYETDFKGK